MQTSARRSLTRNRDLADFYISFSVEGCTRGASTACSGTRKKVEAGIVVADDAATRGRFPSDVLGVRTCESCLRAGSPG